MFQFENTVIYYFIARHSYNRGQELLAAALEMEEGLNQREMQGQALMLSYTAVVFAAFTLEAAINSYGRATLGKKVFEESERNRVVDKWKKWPVAPGEKYSSTDRKRFSDTAGLEPLKELFKRRDGLAHDKPFATDNGPVDPNGFMSMLTAYYDHINHNVLSRYLEFDPIDSVRKAMLGLAEVDPRVGLQWLDAPLGPPYWETP